MRSFGGSDNPNVPAPKQRTYIPWEAFCGSPRISVVLFHPWSSTRPVVHLERCFCCCCCFLRDHDRSFHTVLRQGDGNIATRRGHPSKGHHSRDANESGRQGCPFPPKLFWKLGMTPQAVPRFKEYASLRKNGRVLLACDGHRMQRIKGVAKTLHPEQEHKTG